MNAPMVQFAALLTSVEPIQPRPVSANPEVATWIVEKAPHRRSPEVDELRRFHRGGREPEDSTANRRYHGILGAPERHELAPKRRKAAASRLTVTDLIETVAHTSPDTAVRPGNDQAYGPPLERGHSPPTRH